MDQHSLLIILGPTASGKTRLAVQVARQLQGEIISADSRQVFRGMDIGTGKDLAEYSEGGTQVPYHLINIRDAGDAYHVNAFKDDFYRVYEQLSAAGTPAVVCGGTGMYIHSLLQQQDYTEIPVDMALRAQLAGCTKEELREKLQACPAEFTARADLSSAKRMVRALEIAAWLQQYPFEPVRRPVLRPLIFGLDSSVELRRAKVLSRLKARLKEGLIEEVAGLLAQGVPAEQLIFYGMEYKFVTRYLLGQLDRDAMEEQLYIAIRQFAKRQMTFFRKMEKDGVQINWLSAARDTDQLSAEIVSRYTAFLQA